MAAESILREKIRIIEGFPEPGISFKDITTLIRDPKAYKLALDAMADLVKDLEYDYLVGPEARGFIFGAPLSIQLGRGFIPVRKEGKLPFKTVSYEYDLEYGTDKIYMHADAVGQGDRVLIVDDLLATGGTAQAVAKMVEEAGAEVVGFLALIELMDLKGRGKLAKYPVRTVIKYDR